MKGLSRFIRKLLSLIFPFGKKKLAFIFTLGGLQGVLQAVSIFSILPFLVLATNPGEFLKSKAGIYLMKFIPAANESDFLLYVGVATIALLVSSNIISGLADYYRSKYAYYLGEELGGHLLGKYATQPYAYHLQHNSSELVKRLQNDVNIFVAAVLLPSLDLSSRVINVLCILLILMIVNPIVCLVAFVVFGLLVGISYLIFRKPIISGNIERRIYVHEQYLYAYQLLTGIKTVMIHKAQEYFVKRYRFAWKKLAKHDTFVGFATNGPRYTIEGVAFSSVVILVLWLRSKGGSLEDILPTLVFFVVASYRILPSLLLAYSQVTRIQSQKATFDIIYSDYILFGGGKGRHHKPVKDGDISFFKKIVFDNISYKYPQSEKFSLQNINFEIQKGKSVGVVGSSGSGKSTMVDLLIGLLQPTQGSVKIDDVELTPKNSDQWQGLIGYVSQEIFLLDDTIRKNIAFGIQEDQIDDEKIKEVCLTAQIHDYIVDELPDQYNTLCGERGIRLSGGQRQRIALARALYHNPTLIVFDEATSALDNETESNFIEAIDALPEYLTIVMIAHRLSSLRHCDEILVFDNGSFKGKGVYSDLVNKVKIN